ncbi:hypothetical protein ACNUDN_24985 [Mycobacterium sp. smrl_JER01]|uniref:hypothetical protein n=1 Tax=Mycobacterium sp. smrl_JER01 TaxID=3402633 RepID=UPI003AD55CD0
MSRQCGRTSSAQVETPREITEVVQAYVDAGATQVAPFDLLGSWGGSEVTLDVWTSDTVRWQLGMFCELKGRKGPGA